METIMRFQRTENGILAVGGPGVIKEQELLYLAHAMIDIAGKILSNVLRHGPVAGGIFDCSQITYEPKA